MKKYLLAALIVALSLCGITFATAQTHRTSDANVYGHIIDSKTKEHIPYVTISIKGTTIGTVADASGHYFMNNLPEGTHTVVAESLNYKSAEQQVTVTKGKSVELNFLLQESVLSMDAVVVSATRNETNKKSSATIVNVSSTKLFENTASSNLAETLRFQPGLRVENTCGNCALG